LPTVAAAWVTYSTAQLLGLVVLIVELCILLIVFVETTEKKGGLPVLLLGVLAVAAYGAHLYLFCNAP
jgi:hypothetical protein